MMVREDEQGLTMFHRAATDLNWDIIREADETLVSEKDFLLDASLDKTSKGNGDTPLIIACMKMRKDCLQETNDRAFITNLLKYKIDVNKCNHRSLWTALHWASQKGDDDTVEALLKKGASPALPDCRGNFPMDLAGYFGHLKIVKLLVNKSLELIKVKAQTQKQELTLGTTSIPGKNDLKIQKMNAEGIESLFSFETTFLASSFFASRMLFWASLIQDIEFSTVQFILANLSAYPEAPMSLKQNQTALHAVTVK